MPHADRWQGRFASFPMDEPYLYAATRYVELNPVRAGLVSDPTEYRWSSGRAHVEGSDDVLVKVQPLLERFGDWRQVIGEGLSDEDAALLRGHERTGRPLGSAGFVECVEKLLNRVLKPQKRGRKPKPKTKRRVKRDESAMRKH